jgi:class 3 adenylate cyclase
MPRRDRTLEPRVETAENPISMLMSVLAVLCLIAAAAAAAYLGQRFRRNREELSRVRDLFSRYVPGQVVDELLARPVGQTLWGQRHYATVVCCRIRNFDFFAEELTAEETLRHLNEFYAVAGRAIVRHNGVIERLHADGITAVFGVLTSDVFQEERALRSALRIVRLANALNARWKDAGRRPFHVSIGVNSGNVVAGEVGFAQRREFAIVGNPAHVAARLQQAAEDLNASILASAATYEPVADLFAALAIEKLPLLGLRKLQKAYSIRGLAKRSEEESLHLQPEIPALQTVIMPETVAPPEEVAVPFPVHAPLFSSLDDATVAMPEPPLVTGEYEEPQRYAEAPWPLLPEAPHRSDR